MTKLFDDKGAPVTPFVNMPLLSNKKESITEIALYVRKLCFDSGGKCNVLKGSNMKYYTWICEDKNCPWKFRMHFSKTLDLWYVLKIIVIKYLQLH